MSLKLILSQIIIQQGNKRKCSFQLAVFQYIKKYIN